MSEQPEALWLADFLDAEANVLDEGRPPDLKSTKRRAAAELRRLHSVNAELLEALKRVKETRVFIGAIPQEMMDNAIARAAPEVKP